MSKKAIIALVVLVIVVAGGIFWVTRQNPTDTKTNTGDTNTSTTPEPTGSSGSTTTPTGQTTTITYSDDGYSPGTVTVKTGDTVVIKNTSSRSMQFDSDPHPVHTTNPELNVGSVPPGQSMTFTVDTKGTFGYHNHLNASEKGTIVVE